jgi:hypothetical protein
MKTSLRKSFHNLFIEGNATPVEMGRVAVILILPVLTAVILYIATHHVTLP